MNDFLKTPKQLGSLIFTAAVAIGLITSTVWQPCWFVHGNSAFLNASLPSMNLTMVALNGTQLVLNEADIQNLPSYESYGGYKNILGNIKGLGNYTGVPLTTLCSLIGGINANNSVRITAIDNYTTIFSYDQVNGSFTTYDNITGQEVPHTKPLTSILAYYFDHTDLPESDGPLRVAIVGPEGLTTFSGYWVKQVVKLEIRYLDQVNITAISPLKTAVGQNCPCRVNVTIANQGFYNDTFTVTAYANQTSIGTQALTLTAGNSTTIVFIWNTTGFAFGNYDIDARVGGDPLFRGGNVRVSVPGDVNGDAKVDIYDAIILAGAYGSTPRSTKWNPNADINDDQTVDIYDAIILAGSYGKTS
jgi:hypothetical protein